MQSLVVLTSHGPVRGRIADGVARYFNIPYAAAPVDALRFRAPEPHATWTDVREAIELGPNAPDFLKDFPGLDVEPLIGTGNVGGTEGSARGGLSLRGGGTARFGSAALAWTARLSQMPPPITTAATTRNWIRSPTHAPPLR